VPQETYRVVYDERGIDEYYNRLRSLITGAPAAIVYNVDEVTLIRGLMRAEWRLLCIGFMLLRGGTGSSGISVRRASHSASP
jgi:hypothetical protein